MRSTSRRYDGMLLSRAHRKVFVKGKAVAARVVGDRTYFLDARTKELICRVFSGSDSFAIRFQFPLPDESFALSFLHTSFAAAALAHIGLGNAAAGRWGDHLDYMCEVCSTRSSTLPLGTKYFKALGRCENRQSNMGGYTVGGGLPGLRGVFSCSIVRCSLTIYTLESTPHTQTLLPNTR